MVGTRLVVAVMAGAVLVGSVVAGYFDRKETATWLIAVGSGLATFWAILSFFWAENNPAMVSSEMYLALSGSGIVMTWYVGLRAFEGNPLGSRQR